AGAGGTGHRLRGRYEPPLLLRPRVRARARQWELHDERRRAGLTTEDEMSKLARLVALLAAALLVGASSTHVDRPGGGGKPLDGQKVEVAAVWTGTEQKNFKKVLDAFRSKTGASVTFTST